VSNVKSALEIAVPASVGNLGPGFDALSVALQLYLRLRVTEAAVPGDSLETVFVGPAPDGENAIVNAFRTARARAGVPVPGIRAEVSADIPMRAGLGSSAAATVAGLRLYQALTSALTDDEILAIASELEGHPDNAAACLLGGVTISCCSDDGRLLARSFPWPERLRLVAATPQIALATRQARAVLPRNVSLADAVFNLQHALLLMRALEDERYDDLKEAFRDRWHQPPRTALVPGLREALAIDDRSILGVCLSGSGPTIVAIARPGHEEEAARVFEDIYGRIALPVTIRVLSAHQPHHAAVAASRI
jgi:homoserine kinase